MPHHAEEEDEGRWHHEVLGVPPASWPLKSFKIISNLAKSLTSKRF